MIQAKLRGWMPCAHLPRSLAITRLRPMPCRRRARPRATVAARRGRGPAARPARRPTSPRRASPRGGRRRVPASCVARCRRRPGRAGRARWRGGRWPPAGGRGTPCGTARRATGKPGRDQLVEVGQQREVVAQASCRSRSPGRSRPRRRRRPWRPRPERRGSSRTSPTTSSYVGVLLHRPRDRPACAWPPSRRRARRPPRGGEAETSLTIVAPAATAATAVSALRVSTETRHVVGQRLDHRQHPPLLLGRLDRLGARPGRLAADVDDGGPRGEQVQPVGDGARRLEPASPVGERIGRDVDDAHDLRLHEGARVLGPAPPTRARTGRNPARLSPSSSHRWRSGRLRQRSATSSP